MSQNPANFHPNRPTPHWAPRLPVLGGVAALTAGCAAVVILLLSSGTSNAFAGWASVPTPPSRATLATARHVCARDGALPPAGVLAAETTGPFSAVLYQNDGSQVQCVIRGHEVLMDQVPIGLPGTLIGPTAGEVEFPLTSRVLIGAAEAQQHALIRRTQTTKTVDPAKALVAVASSPDSLQAVSGQVGAGVQRVTFVLRDGARVHATIGHDWYLAWWPTNNPKLYGNAPSSILITTARGTTSAPYSAARLLGYFRLCLKVLC